MLEGVHALAVEFLKDSGYTSIDYYPQGFSEEELAAIIGKYHFLGIRSRTIVSQSVLEKAKNLMAIGCFCIGTNQVNLQEARKKGICVFNAPYSNTRSVAELVVAEMILLMRRTFSKSVKAHAGIWEKSAHGSREVRGKTCGIIGYGHIGGQVSILAESMGMKVLYYDTQNKLPYGNAVPAKNMREVLEKSDIITLHVPGTPQTKNLMGLKEFKIMKKGAIFINASRGDVVVIEALVKILEDEHLSGAAVDVFPKEPKAKGETFQSPLQNLDNVILTPHVGGSTLEAQENIGREVAEKLVIYSDMGTTLSSVNFPEVHLPNFAKKHRFLHIHGNYPNILQSINKIFSKNQINISGQYLQTNEDIGYVVTDIDVCDGYDKQKAFESLQKIPGTIKVRVLF